MNWRDILTRAAWTFVRSFVGALAIDQAGWANLDALQVAALAGVAAVLSLIKTIAAQQLAQ